MQSGQDHERLSFWQTASGYSELLDKLMLQAARATVEVSGGVRIMSQPNSFDEEAFRNYMEELPDLLTGEGSEPDGVFPRWQVLRL